MNDPGDRAFSVVKLPDGRWGVRNERDVSDITREDVEEIYQAVMLWLNLKWRTRDE